MELDGYCKYLGIAFEHQGQQHYKSLKHFGGDSQFKLTQADDATKAKLCKEHGIQLIRVPALFTIMKLEDFQQWLYDECQRLGIDTPDDMLTKKISLKSAWKGTRTVKQLAIAHELARDKGGECLATEYVNAHAPMEFKCDNPEHPSWMACLMHIKKGTWCKKCANERRRADWVLKIA
jgi:hypothetical protein